MSSAMLKLDKIVESIDNIDFILQSKDIKITKAIEDKLIKPAIRNYIAHDYDSTDEHIIEDVIRYNLPIFKKTIEAIKKDSSS